VGASIKLLHKERYLRVEDRYPKAIHVLTLGADIVPQTSEIRRATISVI